MIITGDTAIQPFNEFFVSNYSYLRGFANLIDSQDDAENLLHDCYLKCRQRIYLSGYTGSTYLNYVRQSMTNTYRTKFRDKKNFVEFQEPNSDDLYNSGAVESGEWIALTGDNYSNQIETKLQQEEQYQQQRKDRDNDMVFKNTCAFEYVDKYFSPKENMVFKTYYVLKHKHLNYKQLAVATNYSQTSVSNIIKRIKKDLKENLMCYIYTGYRIMELKEQLLKVEALLKTDVRQNSQNYKETYFQIFNKNWSGCNCNQAPMKEAIKIWYNKNIELLNSNKL